MRLWGDAIGLGYLKNDQIWQSLQVWPIFLFVFSDHATELRIAQEKNAECQNTISTIKTEVPFLKKILLNILIFWISLLWNFKFSINKKKERNISWNVQGHCNDISFSRLVYGKTLNWVIFALYCIHKTAFIVVIS